MSLFSTLYGGGSGAPIGTIIQGNVNPGGDWLKLDGTIYNKADYPELDTSRMLTFGSNNWVTGQTLTNSVYNVLHLGGTNWYAANTSLTNATAYRSTDDGVTWVAATIPFNGNVCGVRFVNGVLFAMNTWSNTTVMYTSTDLGVNWVARSVSSNNTWGSVGYVNGRYILMPASSSTTTLYAMWSTDLVTWTLTTVGSMGTAGSTAFVYQGKKAVYTRNLGFVVSVISSTTSFHSPDGLTWRSFSPNAFNGSAWSSVNPSTAPQYETENGDLRVSSYIYTTGGSYSAYALNLSLHNVTPLGYSNISVGNNGEVSENYGSTISSMPSGISTIHEYASDVSATSVCATTHNGNMYRRVIDTTKFRAVAPAQSLVGNLASNIPMYMKAR